MIWHRKAEPICFKTEEWEFLSVIPDCIARLCNSTHKEARITCLDSSETRYSECPGTKKIDTDHNLSTNLYLVSELDPGPELVVHRHVGPRPAVGDIPHPLEVHVHDPSVEARISIKRNLKYLPIMTPVAWGLRLPCCAACRSGRGTEPSQPRAAGKSRQRRTKDPLVVWNCRSSEK